MDIKRNAYFIQKFIILIKTNLIDRFFLHFWALPTYFGNKHINCIVNITHQYKKRRCIILRSLTETCEFQRD